MHKFNPANHKRLDSEERRKIMPPELLIDEIEKSAGEYFKKSASVVFADLGCGSGFYSIPLAKRAKNYKGKKLMLFALDINEEMLGIFNGNLKRSGEAAETGGSEGAVNKAGSRYEGNKDESGSCVIKCVKCEEFFIPLEDNSVDILLMANVFHEIEDKTSYLEEIKRVLKGGGAFFLLDWKKEDVNPVMGPPASERISAKEALSALNASGFNDIKELPLYTPSFCIVSKK